MAILDTCDDLYDYFTLWRHAERPRREIEWMDRLLAVPEEPAKGIESGDLLARYLQDRVSQSRRAVRALEEEIYVRRKLHEQSIGELDYQIACTAVSLDRFEGWGVGYNRGIDQKRIELERTLHDLRREKRTWRVRVWEDIVKLRAELRDRRRECEAAERRAGSSPRVRLDGR